jgi:saccharopine dehydrogenase-like NADP-dependent oxidoreductase
MKRVLVLGAGLVAKPLVRYLLDKGHQLTCASRTVSKAERLVDGHPHGKAGELNLQDEARLAQHIQEADLAVSLVPPAFHPLVARICIEQKTPMVTTSYVSDEMETLDGVAKEAGVTVMNEIGVDPGIDHMSAMRIIDQVRGKGGRIVAFKSYCGGLPAPADNDNPFGYKFSWAPRGVLMASRNGAQYLENGRKVVVEPERLFREVHILPFGEIGDFEAYPNRDSIGYLDVYGLQGIQTLYRGTLRNMGWCDCMYNYRKAGLLELDEMEVRGKTYGQFTRELLGAGSGEDLHEPPLARHVRRSQVRGGQDQPARRRGEPDVREAGVQARRAGSDPSLPRLHRGVCQWQEGAHHVASGRFRYQGRRLGHVEDGLPAGGNCRTAGARGQDHDPGRPAAGHPGDLQPGAR